MTEQDQRKVLQAFAELVVASDGGEDRMQLAKRQTACERLLKRIAPDVLKAAKEKFAADDPD